MHGVVFYADNKKGNLVIFVHVIDIITSSEQQVVVVIFLKAQLAAESLRWGIARSPIY